MRWNASVFKGMEKRRTPVLKWEANNSVGTQRQLDRFQERAGITINEIMGFRLKENACRTEADTHCLNIKLTMNPQRKRPIHRG